MKRRIILWVVICLVAVVSIVGAIIFLSHGNHNMTGILSDKYNDKEYIDEINRIEITPALKDAISENEVFMVKMAVMENDISPGNEEKLIPLIKEYGTANTLMGYSYLNTELINWDELEAFIKEIKRKDVSSAIKKHEHSATIYVPSKFSTSDLEKWIYEMGYPSEDITTLDKLAQLYDKDFNELMDKYEHGASIGHIKAELGVVNTNDTIEYVSISEADVLELSNKFEIDEERSKTVLTMLVRLGFNVESISDLNVSNEYELFKQVLQKKYQEEISE